MVVDKSTRDVIEETKPNVDIVKLVSVLSDGRQLMVKLPKEITDFYNVKKGNKMELQVYIKESIDTSINTFKFIK